MLNTQNKKILVVGLGMIGASLCRALKKSSSYNTIQGYDIDKKISQYAVDNDFIDNFESDLKKAIEASDIVVLCVPVSQIKSTLNIVKDFFNTDKVFTDTLSTKNSILNFLSKNKYLEITNFILSHPMAGTENFGIQNSKENLFDDAVTLISPLNFSKSDNISTVKNLWESVNSNYVEIEAVRHDKILSVASHSPHILSFVLSNITNQHNLNNETPWIYSRGSLCDMTRIANSDPKAWAGIFSDNKENIIEYIDKYVLELNKLRSIICSNNDDDLVSYLIKSKPKK